MAGSFGYAAPEIMLREGHGKAVDLWSLGVITYTLLCGYSPFRSESIKDLIEETRSGRVVFHERYWKGVSKDAKDFILTLLQPDPSKRPTAEEALKHPWLTGETATDYDLVPEIKAYMARARLRRGIERVRLANRIEALKAQEDDEDIPSPLEVNSNTTGDLFNKYSEAQKSATTDEGNTIKPPTKPPRKKSNAAGGDIFREVVLAKVRDMKLTDEEHEAREKAEKAEKAEKEEKEKADKVHT